MRRNQYSRHLRFLPAGVIFFVAGLVQAQLIDVDFNNDSAGAAHGGPNPGPTMSGAAVLGAAGDQWNGISTSSGSGISLIYSDGSASAVKMTFTSDGGYDVYSFSGTTPFSSTPYNALMQDYLFNGGVAQTITLSGLVPNSPYNLVLYNAADVPAAGRITFFTVNSDVQTSTWNGSSSTFIAGVDYVIFSGDLAAMSDGSGNMVITYTGNGSAEGDVNGFQLQAIAPTVAITNPASGVYFVAPANISIAADAEVSSGTVTNVQFYANGVSVGSAQTAPFGITANNLTAGAYALTAVATAAGVSATSAVVNVTVVDISSFPKADNDNFADAIPLGDGTFVGYNFTATLEPGEPFSLYNNTVWWSWTAPNSGLACVVTDGSSFDCGVGVYSGSTVSSLSPVANSSDLSTNDTPNYLTFPAVGGSTYYIQVAGGYDQPYSYIVISVLPQGIAISDLKTNLNGTTGVTDFSASVEVANAGVSPQTIELDVVARAGYSWTQNGEENGIDFYLPQGLPPDQVLGSYFVTNLAPGAQTDLIISNVCPAPDVIDTENFGYGWDIFVNYVGTYQDSTFLLSGAWPSISGFNGPGGGVARVDPTASTGSPYQLVSATINGPATVPANSTANYSVTVSFSNGRTSGSSNFISTVWSVSPTSNFSISSSGLFSAGTVTSNTSVTITADYLFGGTTYAISNKVTVIAPPAPVVPVITWANPAGIVYGTALSGAQLDAAAASPANPAVSVTGTFAYNPPQGTVLEAGAGQTLLVTFTPQDTTTYASVSASATINVQKATLSVTANSSSKTYGQTATFAGTEFIASGLVNGDSVAGVTLVSSGAAAAATVAGSPYAIAPSGAIGTGLNNYAITYVNGALTVNPASLTVTANNRPKTYGQSVAFTGTEFTTTPLVNGDSVTSVTLTSSGGAATATVAGSPYAIVPSGATGTGVANYAISYVNGALTVSPASLTVTANNRPKTYGQSVTFTGTEFTTTPLVNGDLVTSVTLTSSGGAATATVAGSPYAIVPSAATGTGVANYAISYVNGALTVNPAALTVTANNQIKAYGQLLTFSGTEFSTSGLLNSDTVNSATLVSSGAAATATLAGSPYAIVPSAAQGAGLNNYTISYINGTLTAIPSALIITADNRTKTFGQTVTFTGTEFVAVGLLNSDSVTSVTLTSSGSGAAATMAGSPYAIVPSAAMGTGLANYSISYINGKLTVAALPTIQSAKRSGNLFTFTWSATPAQAYQVQYTTNLTQDVWANLGGAIAATNSVATASDSITNSEMFYRVVPSQ